MCFHSDNFVWHLKCSVISKPDMFHSDNFVQVGHELSHLDVFHLDNFVQIGYVISWLDMLHLDNFVWIGWVISELWLFHTDNFVWIGCVVCYPIFLSSFRWFYPNILYVIQIWCYLHGQVRLNSLSVLQTLYASLGEFCPNSPYLRQIEVIYLINLI